MREVDYARAAKVSERPSRIALAVSFDEANSRCDIIALGWKMRTSLKPPMAAISVGQTRYSHELILREKEFVLAFPGEDIAREVLRCGTASGREIDKFADTGLTPLDAKHVKPSLIAECPVNYECRVEGVLETGDHTVFSGEILSSYLSEEKKLLLSAGDGDGFRVVLEGKGYRFAVVR
jgi:flavin reductase (DIM6/NTAB) family NADH-FMN oxidoreductase RutF